MKRIKRWSALLMGCLLLAGSAAAPAAADVVAQDSSAFAAYTYDVWGNVVSCPDPYVFRKNLSGVDLGIGEMKKLNDIYAAKDGYLYLAVSGVASNESYLLKLNPQLQLADIFYGYHDNRAKTETADGVTRISLNEGYTSGSAKADYTFPEGIQVEHWLLAYDFTVESGAACPTISYNAYDPYTSETFLNNALEVNLASQIARVAGVSTKSATINGSRMSVLPAGTYKGVLNLDSIIPQSFANQYEWWRMELAGSSAQVTVREFAFVSGVGADHVVNAREVEDVGGADDEFTDDTDGSTDGADSAADGDTSGDASGDAADTAADEAAADTSEAGQDTAEDGTEAPDSGEPAPTPDNNTSVQPPVPDDSTATGEKTVIASMTGNWVQNLVQFREPLGVFVDDDGDVYLADGTLRQVLRMDSEMNIKLAVEPPTAATSAGVITAEVEERYRPSKVVVDPTGRIHVVAINVNEGIMEFSETGVFQGYLAAGKVNYSALELFWRKISTKEQEGRMQQFVPIEYNNLDLDADGFLYATMGAQDASVVESEIQARKGTEQGALVRRLNLSSTDILKRNGYGPPVGDLAIWTRNDAVYTGISQIMDVSCGSDNTYMLLDNNRNHIFAYDSEGFLLYAFGGPDVTTGGLRTPTSLAQYGDYLYVLDTGTRTVTMYEMTDFARNIAAAIRCEGQGLIEEAGVYWQKVLDQNANYDLAYTGLGKIAFQNKDYVKAMECFEKSHNTSWYSKSYKQYRKNLITEYFGPVMIVVLVLIAAGIVLRVVLAVRKRRKEARQHEEM